MYDNNQNDSRETRGAMFPREKKSQNSPDMTGDFVLTGDVLDYVAAQLQQGNGNIKLYISTWRKMSKNQQPMVSMSIRIPMEAQPGQQQGNNYRGNTNVVYNQAAPPRNTTQRYGPTATPNTYGQQTRGQVAQFPTRAQQPIGQGTSNPGLDFPDDTGPPF